ncbi:MAG: Ig domain-containing protein, partial [Acidobacteria bacterium]|nr:Ig domain-containing protein [Acidobacteriota bacterium]
DYWASPRADISKDGRFIAFTSNWGVPDGRTDVFVIRVPGQGYTPQPAAAAAPIAPAAPQPAPQPAPQAPAAAPFSLAGSIADGQVNQPYDQSIAATGGTTPYSFSLSGKLPIGLKFDTYSGMLSGTPMSQGTFTVTVQAADSAGDTTTQTYELTIAPQS